MRRDLRRYERLHSSLTGGSHPHPFDMSASDLAQLSAEIACRFTGTLANAGAELEQEPDDPAGVVGRAASALHGGDVSSRLRLEVAVPGWVLAPPMLGDLVASADPDPVMAQDVIDETGKRGGASRLA